MSKVTGNKETPDCESWILPQISHSGDANNSILTASQIEAVQKQAYEEAYAEGHAQGYKAGQEEGLNTAKQQTQALIEVLDRTLSKLATPLEELDDQVDHELVILVQTLVKQMVRREIKIDPGQVMAVIRQAIESLPVASRQLQLRLHPEDAKLVHEFYQTGKQDLAWDIVEDPLISRGGCKVITAVTQVDATLETRLTQLFAQVFGERQQDAGE
jgi:flagellar assembly protein FliH